ncbi:unnamed protein product [Knipowitschia caucasica]|uniref:Uncharacterized protein n=1 Tax=Knipowitschia caucasica TaxID=637954 RepID=A0AAV2L4W6_KNICA
MGEDNDLEKRAIEELLRETDRARVRAETMGPTGWLKCPLKSTNKRFLLNTLRSTGLKRRSDEESSSSRRFRSESSERRRDRSRSPSHRSRDRHQGHRDESNREDRSMEDLKCKKEKERRDGHGRERKHVEENGGHRKHRHK